ncbi:hypothetical protein [Mesorhizobium carmichaelinearum]|uniref:hypothetical protein n=1 Tax=Mesorhizobium carmichaelinearum TaxID=1208188 RepID=UPI001FCF159E|nr:hypothetical protein [Mesorhizobium carmichaelinearum]
MITKNTAVTVLELFLTTLAESGWAHQIAGSAEAEAIVRQNGFMGDLLGKRVAGRGGALEEFVRPQTPDRAHPRSLSALWAEHVAVPHRTEPPTKTLPLSPSQMHRALDRPAR